MDVDKLIAAGFTHDDDLKAAQEQFAVSTGMHTGGPYVVQGAWRRGLTTLLFEQNTAPEPSVSNRVVSISHPAVCIVTGPQGKAACDAEDIDLILWVADDLAGLDHSV
jgi:hypothetical protein